MESFKIVRPEHLNHHGVLFGGEMLKWVDEYAWLSACRDFSGCRWVTIGMDKVEFKNMVLPGSILHFCTDIEKKGNTSVTYLVRVFADEEGAKDEKEVFSTLVTLVNVDKDGQKAVICK
ncbi:MAG: acyl-CoA thioesterase [Spirochaetales bacterium]|nr:acyl-CoA thioesterase [Spirochaetales bacterium]